MNIAQRAVPWSNWREWRYVRDLLYSADIEQQWKGVDIVEAWKCRSSILPVSVESTALFTGLIMKIELALQQNQNHHNASNIAELHNASAMAIIRMVNGLVDTEQKGYYKRSVNNLANDIGLPRNFVDIRHRCTHMNMPDIITLLEALKSGKEWMYYNYWCKQEQSLYEFANSIIEQLTLVSKIVSSACDAQTFSKKGDIYSILKNIFQVTSNTDFVEYVIPALTGNALCIPIQTAPLLLPDFSAIKISQSEWINNWVQVITIAQARWGGFTSCLVENVALYLSQENDDRNCLWLIELIKVLLSESYYQRVTHNQHIKEKEVTICSHDGQKQLQFNMRTYMLSLIRSSKAVILDFVSSYFNLYITEKEKQLINLRKEMLTLETQSNDTETQIQDNIEGYEALFEKMNQTLCELDQSRSSIAIVGNTVRNEDDILPIGSVLF